MIKHKILAEDWDCTAVHILEV